MRSGWNMPPGTFRVPGDDEGVCEVCCNPADSCVCPECPYCKEHGNPKCYKTEAEGGYIDTASAQPLRLSREQILARQRARVAVARQVLLDEELFLDWAIDQGEGLVLDEGELPSALQRKLSLNPDPFK